MAVTPVKFMREVGKSGLVYFSASVKVGKKEYAYTAVKVSGGYHVWPLWDGSHWYTHVTSLKGAEQAILAELEKTS